MILAAGLGRRLVPTISDCPKGFIAIDGQTLVGRSVAQLIEGGYDLVRIVTGYQADKYVAAFGQRTNVELIYNPHFCTTGSLLSLQCGLDGIDPQIDQVAILESDILFENRAIDIMKTMRAGILTSGPTGAGDEVYVWADPDTTQLVHLSRVRTARAEAPLGELTGLNVIRGSQIKELRAVLAQYVQNHPEADYEDGLVAASRILQLRCHLVDDLIWAEIDDATMLRHAQEVIWPKIKARDT